MEYEDRQPRFVFLLGAYNFSNSVSRVVHTYPDAKQRHVGLGVIFDKYSVSRDDSYSGRLRSPEDNLEGKAQCSKDFLREQSGRV